MSEVSDMTDDEQLTLGQALGFVPHREELPERFMKQLLQKPFDEMRYPFHKEILERSSELSNYRSWRDIRAQYGRLMEAETMSDEEAVAFMVLRWVMDDTIAWPFEDRDNLSDRIWGPSPE